MRPASIALVALLAATATRAAPLAATTPPAECNRPGHAWVLTPEAAGRPSHARAVWLDAHRLRWNAPVARNASRAVLLTLTPGDEALAIDALPPSSAGVWALHTVGASTEPDRRFSYIAGDTYAVADSTFRLGEALQNELYVALVDGAGRLQAMTRIQHAGALDALYAESASTLAYWPAADASAASLRLWAPTAQAVSVCLYRDAAARADSHRPLQRHDASGSWQAVLPGDWRNAYFTYLVDVIVPGVGLVRQRVTDPYSLGLSTQSQRSQLIDLNDPATQPAQWQHTPRPQRVHDNTDLVVYELHVRDFSRDDRSVPALDRGKFAAFTHTNSHGMKHLRQLGDAGVTDIHLLPTYDLATVPEQGCTIPALPTDAAPTSDAVQAAIGPVREHDCFNWGYDPLHYTVPEGSYSSDPADSRVRVREFRAMVQALHRANLRVGLDVVYNHTMAAEQDALSVLDRIVPGYYHRLDAEGAVATSTCCANTATENAMMAKLMVDSAVVWARDYRIDSFRFDLMGHQPKAAMVALQDAVDAAAGQRIHLLGEGWNFGEVADGARFPQAAQGVLNGTGIATFSDRMRDAARGGRAGDRGDALFAQGWLSGLHLAPNEANAQRPRVDSERDLRAAEALIRAGLAGTLLDYPTFDSDGVVKPLSAFRYGDGPAGYVSQPGEVVNYTENHDNLTLFDSNALRLPLGTSRHQRARAQVLGNALVLLAQGVAYLHAGQEVMRSKSLDRNSYNSGDAFNRVDWTGERSALGTGLPPAWDNEDSWPQMRQVLERTAHIAPRGTDVQYVRDWTLALLRLRRDAPLLRLQRADDIRTALRFHPITGEPGVVVGHLNGRLLPATHPAHASGELLYVINTDPRPRRATIADAAGEAWASHPALDGRIDGSVSASGEITINGRSVAVFVR